MIEAKLGSMEEETRRGKRLTAPREKIPDVDSFAHQRMSALREVDPDLVGPSGLQPDLAEGCERKPLQNLHMSDGLLSFGGFERRGSAEPVAAIG
jgi:hypothetical protein